MASVDAVTCADRTMDRRGHRPCGAVATRGTDSAIGGGAAAGPASGCMHGPDRGIHDSWLVTAIGQSLACQREVGDAQECQCETEQCREFLDTSSKCQDLLPKLQLGEVRHVHGDHHGRQGAKPSPGRRPRNATIGGDRRIPGALNEFAEPMVIALLRTGRGHETDHQLSDDRRSNGAHRNALRPRL